MSKKGKVMVIMIGIIVQICLGILYGFSEMEISPFICLILWGACAFLICRFSEMAGTI